MTFQEEFAEDLGTIFPGFRGDLWGGLNARRWGESPFPNWGGADRVHIQYFLLTDYVSTGICYIQILNLESTLQILDRVKVVERSGCFN